MKLSEYARQAGVSYKTAWRWWKSGVLQGYQLPSGTIIVGENQEPSPLDKTEAVIARLETQIQLLQASLQQAEAERSHLFDRLEQASVERSQIFALLTQILGHLEALNLSQPSRWNSEVGMDYSQLESLLVSGRWQEADEYTWLLILAIAGQETALTFDDINTFPLTDLHTLDRIWAEYSENRFGFGRQKAILESADWDYTLFCDTVGWRVRQKWLYYDELSFSLAAPNGHLPVVAWRRRACYGVGMSLAADMMNAIAYRLNQI